MERDQQRADHHRKIEQLVRALKDGERSGEPRLFDAEAFLAGLKAKYTDSRID